jgi:hypothetical protein
LHSIVDRKSFKYQHTNEKKQDLHIRSVLLNRIAEYLMEITRDCFRILMSTLNCRRSTLWFKKSQDLVCARTCSKKKFSRSNFFRKIATFSKVVRWPIVPIYARINFPQISSIIEILPADFNVAITEPQELTQQLTVLIEWMDRVKQKRSHHMARSEGISVMCKTSYFQIFGRCCDEAWELRG